MVEMGASCKEKNDGSMRQHISTGVSQAEDKMLDHPWHTAGPGSRGILLVGTEIPGGSKASSSCVSR